MSSLFEQQVLPLFEEHRGDWLVRAREAAHQLGAGGATVTIDDVRTKCPPPHDVDPRVMGAVFLRKHWENCGYTKGTRPESNGRPIAQFKLKHR